MIHPDKFESHWNLLTIHRVNYSTASSAKLISMCALVGSHIKITVSNDSFVRLLVRVIRKSNYSSIDTIISPLYIRLLSSSTREALTVTHWHTHLTIIMQYLFSPNHCTTPYSPFTSTLDRKYFIYRIDIYKISTVITTAINHAELNSQRTLSHYWQLINQLVNHR